MRLVHWLVVAVLAAALALFVAGCGDSGGDGARDADALFEEGMAQLQNDMDGIDMDDPPWDWGIDASDAFEDFDGALDADPDHCGALLMAALTRILVVLTDPDLADILDDVFDEESFAAGRLPIFWVFDTPDIADVRRIRENIAERNRDDFPFSELQDYIEDEVIPALDYVDGNFSDFEDLDCELTLVIDVPARDDTTLMIQIDATDVYFAHGPVDALQSLFHMIVAYNVDVEEGQTLEELIDEDPNFTSLRPGNHMGTAYDELTDMVGHMDDALTSLTTETGNQTYDLITETAGMYFVLDEMFEVDGAADSLAMIVQEIEDALTSPYTINPHEMDPEDPFAPDIDITFDIQEMFDDPLDPLKAYLPAHTFPEPDEFVLDEPLTFPDPTFDGIFIGMTDEDWRALEEWWD